MHRSRLLTLASTGVLLPLLITAAGGTPAHADTSAHGVDHIVVIYEENHSFDNLYGLWGAVNGQQVNGLGSASESQKQQLGQDGAPLTCTYQNDVNLASPPLAATCTDSSHPVNGSPVSSHFGNAPFSIDDYIKASDTTCPAPGVYAANGVKNGSGQPGGCTEDIVHRFYQEQYQVNGGQQNRYVAGSDAAGLVMGHYDTPALPIYQYLHSSAAPRYVVADNFFQGGWGGSFLNHQILVAAQAPVFAGADKSGSQTSAGCGKATDPAASGPCDLHSVVDANGFPTSYPYYKAAGTVKDNQLTEAAGVSGGCAPSYAGAAATPTAGILCGDYAVNTIQPFTQPYSPGTAVGKRLPLLRSANIGDELSTKNVSWAWYSGGWDNAAGNNGRDALHPLGPGWTNGTGASCSDPNTSTNSAVIFPNCPDKNFQFHHQPFGYFANYADGTVGRVDHLKDEQQFLSDAKDGNLPAVSFVKPIGSENEHPGYASESLGSDHLVSLLKTIESGPAAAHTMVVVTYDEFGGQWDHVAPPGTAPNPGIHDAFGPGTRIPALVLDPALPASGVDHTSHDTTSVLATIEHRFGLPPLTDGTGAQTRDAKVADLFSAFSVQPAPATAPCGVGRGSYSLRISPTFAQIHPGGFVTLFARLLQDGRPCQPGLRVGWYVRGPGAAGFHLSRVVTTGDSGLVSTTYSRPGSDFRWFPASAGIAGPNGLVQVR
ncbi:MAG: acid phosphatase [Mycobacteriales bacterium]